MKNPLWAGLLIVATYGGAIHWQWIAGAAYETVGGALRGVDSFVQSNPNNHPAVKRPDRPD